MAELSTLARPYAKAAFEFANQNSQLAQWADTLGLLSALSEQQNVAKLFNSTIIAFKAVVDLVCKSEYAFRASFEIKSSFLILPS